MPVNWPDFSDPLLRHVSVCMRSRETSLLDKYEDTKIDWDAQYGDGFWCHLLIDKSAQDRSSELPGLHFHVDAVREIRPPKEAPNHKIDEIVPHIEAFFGTGATAFMAACFKIPKDCHPTRGIIPAMLGIATESDECTLTVSGARMSIAGCDFDELEWCLDTDENLLVTLDAFHDIEVHENFLQDAIDFLRDGLGRFVLGSDQAVHVIHDQVSG